MALSPEQKQAAAVAALVAAQAQAYKKLEDALVEQVQKLMSQLFQRWYFQDEVDKIAKKIARVVRDAQEAIADMTEAYLDAIFDAMNLRVPNVNKDKHVKLPARLRAVDPRRQWNRPAEQARVSRLLGADEFEANEKALQRAEEMARMDAALAMQAAEQQRWGIAEGITGYRRIIHPELPGNVCGLCVVASSRIYRTNQLKRLHGGCRCTVLPVTKTQDPGKTMNEDELRDYYEAAGSNRREDLQRVVVKTIAHGELGPILVDNKYKNRTTNKPKTLENKFDSAELFKIQNNVIRKYEAAVKAGRTPQFDIEYHRRLRAKYAKQLGISIDEAA